jgi:hypothetical protein
MSDPQAIPIDDQSKTTTSTLGLIAHAAQRGAMHVREAAARTCTVTERFVSRSVYTTCYAISYGVVFPSVLLARSIPVNNAAARGLIDGAHGARQKVDELYNPALKSSTDAASPALSPA